MLGRGVVLSSAKVEGLSSFVRLDASNPRLFRKEVLRVWSGIDPKTGQAISFDRPFLERLALNTNRWIELGYEVDAPDGHTDSAVASLGRWLSFRVEGDQLTGTFEAADDKVAGMIGTRIRGVSIMARGPETHATGERFDVVLLHVCLTNNGVLPSQSNFVRLARGEQETSMTTEIKLAKDAGAADAETETATGMSPKDAAKVLAVLFGLSIDAGWDDIVAAARSCMVDEEEEDEGGASAILPPAYMSRLAREVKAATDKTAASFTKDIDALKKLEAKRRHDGAVAQVELARKQSADAGIPLAEDDRVEIVALLESEDDRLAKAGRKQLDLHMARASDLGRSFDGSARPVKPASAVDEDKAIAESDAAVAEMCMARGIKYEPAAKSATKGS